MKRTRQFTLIELLLVIGIMILIMGLTVPSFRRMASGNAVNASARMLAGQLNLARAAAIAEQRYIAIIMPGNSFKKPDASGASGNSTDEYHYRSFRVGVVTPISDYEFKLLEWYPGANWTFLPRGAVIAEVNDSAIAASDNESDTKGVELYESEDKHARFINITNWLTNDKLRKDDSEENGKTCKVIDNGSSVSLADGKSNNTARAIVFNPKGRCCIAQGKTADLYVTIVEGSVDETPKSDGTLEDTELLQGKIHNMKILKIGQYTGRVEYVNLEAED